MIKNFKEFEAKSVDLKGKISKLKKAMDDNKTKKEVVDIVHVPRKVDISDDLEYSEIIESVRKNFSKSFIDDYIIHNFYKYCDYVEMYQCGYTNEIQYYKEYVDCEGIEDDLIDDIWKFVESKYSIDLDDDKYKKLRVMIFSYIQENFPFFKWQGKWK